MRGIASLFVANFHFLCAFVPQAVSEYSDHPWAWSDTPLSILYNGGFAVSIFFVLSGFVIANSAARRHLPLAFNLAQRYVRLAAPVLVSTILAWLMLTTVPAPVGALKAVVPSRWLTYVYDGNLPGLSAALVDGVVGVFVTGRSDFNNVLWTMRIELIGSCLIYVIYIVERPRIVLGFLCAILVLGLVVRPEIAAFMIGALLREAVVARRLRRIMPWPLLLVGIVLGATMQGYDRRVIEGLLHLPVPDFFARHESLALGEPHKLFHVIASTLVIYGLLTLPALQRVLSHPVFRFLGRISFGFYLVHVVLIYTVIGRLYLAMPDHGIVGLAAVYLLFLSASLAAGYLFTLSVDRPVMQAIHMGQRWFTKADASYFGPGIAKPPMAVPQPRD